MKILFSDEDTVILTKSNSGAAVPPEVLQESLIKQNKSCKIYITGSIKETINTY